MFTGLIEEVGVISAITDTSAGVEVGISSGLSGLADGESISVNGVCLTVLDAATGWFAVAAMTMTLGRTTVGDWKAGTRVNLERAMRADSRFGGHIVQGHVDGVALLERVEKEESATLLDLILPEGAAGGLVLHGSVALDGVSLTVNALDGDNLQVALIDYTLSHTALSDLGPGSRVNVETDVIGKYVQRVVVPYLKR